jgi:polyhydroxybutyrate depolymerase
MVSGGRLRSAVVAVPASVPTGDVSLLLALHGLGGSGASVLADLELGSRLARDAVIGLFPDGVGSSWNAGVCCRPAIDEKVDDESFLIELMDEVVTALGLGEVDAHLFGWSNGGMMAYGLLCRNARRFATVMTAMATNTAGCAPSSPLPMLHVAGTADQVVPYSGGWSAAVPFVDGSLPGVYESVAEIAAEWRCAAAVVSSPVDRLEIEDWSGCLGGVGVRLARIIDAVHVLPVGEPLDAPTVLWDWAGLAA